jgi:hypothetical protein
MPAIYQLIDSLSSVFNLLLLLNASTVLLPKQTPAATPAAYPIRPSLLYLQHHKRLLLLLPAVL